jgi:hypothetical protein
MLFRGTVPTGLFSGLDCWQPILGGSVEEKSNAVETRRAKKRGTDRSLLSSGSF